MKLESAVPQHLTCPRTQPKRMRQWHEVMVLPADAQSFEYVHCHPRTGLIGAAAP